MEHIPVYEQTKTRTYVMLYCIHNILGIIAGTFLTPLSTASTQYHILLQ